jgi:hypothetical protein
MGRSSLCRTWRLSECQCFLVFPSQKLRACESACQYLRFELPFINFFPLFISHPSLSSCFGSGSELMKGGVERLTDPGTWLAEDAPWIGSGLKDRDKSKRRKRTEKVGNEVKRRVEVSRMRSDCECVQNTASTCPSMAWQLCNVTISYGGVECWEMSLRTAHMKFCIETSQ